MTTIRDNAHDHIEVEGTAKTLLNTPETQHLRHIKQLGTVQPVYPSTNHIRLGHSLGIYHLASHAFSHLSIEGNAAARVEATVLLRDVGHSPYSHNIENVAHRHAGKYHDDVKGLVAHGAVGGMLESEGLDPECIAALVEDDDEFDQFISGELDVDRMDYLTHGAHHTGVPYGTISHERLIRELTFVGDELVLAEGNVRTAESLLLTRALMNPAVYQHHVTRISKAMLRRAPGRLLDEDIDARELYWMNNPNLLAALRFTNSTNAFAERLATHGLYKRAVWAELPSVPDLIIDAEHDALAAFERDIAAATDMSPESITLDVLSRPSMTKSSSQVMVNGEI